MPLYSHVIYMITFPNGKIYIGKDVGAFGHSLRYFGSWRDDLIEADFSRAELSDFTIRKTILFESTDPREISRVEPALIRDWRSNDPKVGYNRWPKFRG